MKNIKKYLFTFLLIFTTQSNAIWTPSSGQLKLAGVAALYFINQTDSKKIEEWDKSLPEIMGKKPLTWIKSHIGGKGTGDTYIKYTVNGKTKKEIQEQMKAMNEYNDEINTKNKTNKNNLPLLAVEKIKIPIKKSIILLGGLFIVNYNWGLIYNLDFAKFAKEPLIFIFNSITTRFMKNNTQ